MRLIIAGSRPPKKVRESNSGLRRWYEQHRGTVSRAVSESKFIEIHEVVSGKAKGFDLLGEAWAAENHLPVKSFHADWDRHGYGAGPIRNAQMAEYAEALLAITYGTPGTRNMINCMDRLGKPIFVFDLSRLEPAQPYPPAHVIPGRKTEPGRAQQGFTMVPSRREHAGGSHQP